MKFSRLVKALSIGAVLTVMFALYRATHPLIQRSIYPTGKWGSHRSRRRHIYWAVLRLVPNRSDKRGSEHGSRKMAPATTGGRMPDEEVTRRLPADSYEALAMNNETIVNRYLNAGQIIRVAAKNNLLDKIPSKV